MTSRHRVPTYRLRRSLELFFATDGDAYLLRGGSGPEHVIRRPSEEDRALLRRLANDHVQAPPSSPAAGRLAPLIEAGVVVEVPALESLSAEDVERFSRQLPYFEDFDGDPALLQRRLRDSAVGILGCGGLGTWALGALAGTGVGRFVLVDDDRVELSNLNRQVLYGSEDLGASKVDRAAAWVHGFDPAVAVECHALRVRGVDELAAFADCDAVLLTADWPPYELTRWVNAAALRHGFAYIMAGQQPPLIKIGPTYVPGAGVCFTCHERRLRREFPRYDELAQNRRDAPARATTLGPASALVGSALALEVLHLLLGHRPLATQDRVLMLDIRTLETRWEAIEHDPGCPDCGG